MRLAILVAVPALAVMVQQVIAITNKQPDVPVNIAVGAIGALQQRFHLGCVFLLVPHPGVNEDVYGLPLYRFLARRYVSFAVISYKLYLERRWSMYCSTRALIVLSEPTRRETAALLQALSESPYWGFTGVLMDSDLRVSPYGSPVWLLLSPISLSSYYFKDINIPFDCQFLVLLSNGNIVEVYKTEEPLNEGRVWRIRQNKIAFPPQISAVGLWNENDGLRWHIRSFYQRRADLMGARIRVMSMNNLPFTPATFKKGKLLRVEGFIGSVWKLLQESMNFRCDLWVLKCHRSDLDKVYKKEGTLRLHKNYKICSDHFQASDSKIPRLYSQGTEWMPAQSGPTKVSIGEHLFQHRADIALFDSTHTFRIKRQVDFLDPLFMTSYRVYIRHPGHTVRYWSSFVTPFTPTLWLAYLLLMLGSAVMLVLLHFWAQQYQAILPEEQHILCLPMALFSIARAAFQQAHTDTPQWLSTRVAFLACYITGYVFLAAYSARLFASLAEPSHLPFNKLEDLLASGRYKFGAVNGSDGFMILTTTDDPTLKSFFSQGIINRTVNIDLFPKHVMVGLRKVCMENYAFMTEKDYALAYAKYLPCDIVALPMFSMPAAVGIMVIKSYPYIGLFNYNIRKMRESGVLAKLFNDARPSQLPPVDLEFSSLSFQNTRAIFTILGVSYVLAVIILIIEIIHKCAKRQFNC